MGPDGPIPGRQPLCSTTFENRPAARVVWSTRIGRAPVGFARRSEVGCGEARAAASRFPALLRAWASWLTSSQILSYPFSWS